MAERGTAGANAIVSDGSGVRGVLMSPRSISETVIAAGSSSFPTSWRQHPDRNRVLVIPKFRSKCPKISERGWRFWQVQKDYEDSISSFLMLDIRLELFYIRRQQAELLIPVLKASQAPGRAGGGSWTATRIRRYPLTGCLAGLSCAAKPTRMWTDAQE